LAWHEDGRLDCFPPSLQVERLNKMTKGYWFGRIDIIETAPYSEYARLAKAAVGKYGGRYLVRGGLHESVEGEWSSRHVLIEFESYQAALDCYNSPDYQDAKLIRHGKADIGLLILEGSGEDNQPRA